MDATELNFFRAYLLTQKSSILNKSHEFRSEQSSEKAPISDEAELASKELSMSLSIHLHERDRSQLMMIERALGKISEGTYGHCESCAADIGEKRLKARPFASLCINCMEEQEDPRNYLN
jgi:DnaK suppressor protein